MVHKFDFGVKRVGDMSENVILERALLRTLKRNQNFYNNLSEESRRSVDSHVLAFVNALRNEVDASSDVEEIYGALCQVLKTTTSK